MSTTSVEVIVYENHVAVEWLSIRYFDGQAYTVKIDTPDGTDAEASRVIGKTEVPA